jgi:hypothetical protein
MALNFKQNSNLEKLGRVMGVDLSSRTPTIAYINMDGVSRLWVLTSIISTPYILWLLFKLKKYGWLISFSIFVVSPVLLGYFLTQNTTISLLFKGIALINWAVFLFLLRSNYRDWEEPYFKHTPSSDFK